MTTTHDLPVAIDDPINARILSVSEDRISGFHMHPFTEIARLAELDETVVLERIAAMLRGNTIRRVRQTLMANNLAAGALVAWQIPNDKLNSAFDFFHQQDPFSGHVVIRTTDRDTPGSSYRLWTTVKVPQGFSLQKHCEWLAGYVEAQAYRLMPAKKLFALGVGHLRRRSLEPGAMSDEPGRVIDIDEVTLKAEQWQTLVALKREFTADEITHEPWRKRADEAGLRYEQFCVIADELARRGILGRFSTFLEHVKPLADGQRVTRFNGLFHWAVPTGRELEAGKQVGRFHILTHAYWREGGPEFNHVNIMAVAHGMEKPALLEHKAAIDAHLAQVGLPIGYTNVFWGGRSEIKPSEIAPVEYERWCQRMNIDGQKMRG